MANVDINDLASIGVVLDQPPYQLPPEALSLALNVRYRDESVERLLGWSSIFGTPPVAPHFLMPLTTVAQTFWLYTSLTKGYVWDGSNHTNITRQVAAVDVDYTATDTRQWNGTILGGIPILNNGNDVPQSWAPATIVTKLVDLPNWPSTLRAKVIRAFGPFLIAFGLTKSGVAAPHTLRWSHPADPGTVPVSWDIADPTRDAGEIDLPDVNSGIIMDALPLAGAMYVYKEGSTWRLTLIGGQSIFDAKSFLETAGILSERCVTITGDGLWHVMVTQDDIIAHNGNAVDRSIVSKRMKKSFFNALDTSNFRNTFCFTNPLYDEVWICYPEQGQVQPNRALIWNYRTGQTREFSGALSEADGITFRNAAVGPIEEASSESWDSDSGSWDSDLTAWNELQRRRVVLAGTGETKFFQMDIGSQRNGVEFVATAQRQGLSIIGRKRSGEWIVDHQTRKLLTRVWPKVRGGPIRVRVGFQDLIDGPTTWKGYFVFDPTDGSLSPADGLTADLIGSGKAVAIEFTDLESDPQPWTVDGYKIEVGNEGVF